MACAARRGYQSGAQFDRSSREDDQLPITARPLVTDAADSSTLAAANGAVSADAGIRDGTAERGGINPVIGAVNGASAGAAASSHDSDVLEELK